METGDINPDLRGCRQTAVAVKRDVMKTAVLVVASTLFALVLVEVVGRLLIRSDERGYGRLFGLLLPAYKVVTAEQTRATDREASYQGLIVEGRKITLGDIVGYHRLDSVLGYTHLENMTSANGWWHSNNIGARERYPTPEAVPPGLTRWLSLGESFAQGSGLPSEQGWVDIVEASASSLDIVNLAVDGFGMAQSYLRYRSIENQLQHHGVLLMFVPAVDLWRDVNTFRSLGEPWKVQTVMPRFVLEDGSLRLVPGPYSSENELYEDNKDGLSKRLRDHLHSYDRFYFPFEYEPIPIFDHLLTFKIAAAVYGRYERGAIRRRLWRPGSEALQISRAIFDALERDTTSRGRKFVLLILPTGSDLRRLREERGYLKQWSQVVAFVCRGSRRCVDLAAPLQSLPINELDAGLDGTHYGPRVNHHIGAAVLRAIDDNHWAVR